MTLREELEKAFKKHFTFEPRTLGPALWAAQWMAERCAEMCEASTSNSNDTYNMGSIIRQLAKELSQ